MEYKCRLEKLDKITTKDSKDLSLCSVCHSCDCSNPIQNVQISVFGINETIRVYVTSTNYFGVKQCEGFSSRQSVDLDEKDEDED